MYCSGARISWPVSTVTHVYDCKVSLYTVLCKSIAKEFRRNSWLFGAFQRNFAWNDISMKFYPHFHDTYCFDLRNLLNANLLCSMIHCKFPSDNSLLLKSRCDFSNDNALLPKIRQSYCLSTGQERFQNTVRKWPFQSLCTKETINLPK